MVESLPSRSSHAGSPRVGTPPTGVPVPSPAAPTPRSQQARAQVTRQAIVGAATVEFAHAGYRAASLTRIVERSGVTKGALYFHFASKQDLAVAVVGEMEAACRRLTAEAHARALDPLRQAAVIARLMQDMLAGPPVLYAGRRLCAEGLGGPQRRGAPWFHWQAVLGDLLERAAEAGLLRPGVDPVEIGHLITDMSVGAFTASLATTDLADLADRVRHHWDLVLGVIATESWLAGWRAEGGMAAVLAGSPGAVPEASPGGG